MSGLPAAPSGRGSVISAVIAIGVLALVGIGVAVGRLSITTQQRIVHVRHERPRGLLRMWQDELEAGEGGVAAVAGPSRGRTHRSWPPPGTPPTPRR